MAKHDWDVKDIYTANNPTPGAQPATVTYVAYHAAPGGNRVVRLDTPTPTAELIKAAIEADLRLRDAFVGQKGSIA